MFDVNSTEDARKAYSALRLYTEMRPYARDAALLDETLAGIKRNIRKWAHRDGMEDVGMGFKVSRHAICGDFDGYTEVVSIPKVFDTEESAREFFDEFLYIESPNSIYDCTGRPFTSWCHLFKRRGQFWAYHRVAFDV